MYDSVLVCNRGEIAVRIIRTCREMGIRSIAAYSAADRDSLPVRLADDTVCLGPGPAGRSYSCIPAVLYACAHAGADAVHPGYGFLSEDPVFAAACAEAGIAFIGPPVGVLSMMGDKLAARAAMRAVGVRVLPGSDGPLTQPRAAAAVAGEIGYPVVLKAAAGGGGRGIAVVHGEAELAAALDATRKAARSLFGDDRVYLEKFLPGARHVEVQVLADAHGHVVHLGERDCSVQRRRQKLVEESPSPGLAAPLRDELCQAAVSAARGTGFSGVGTVEFLLSTTGEAYFIEMNPRIQVEHPVTELRSGVDLVEWGIRVAAGERLTFTQADVRLAGHAIEARVNAEDTARDWAGSAGRITAMVLPGGPGVRIDTHAYAGYVVPPYYDSLLAKVVVIGDTRAHALRRLDRALAEFHCEGVVTNVDFHRRLVREPDFVSGRYRLDIADRLIPAGR